MSKFMDRAVELRAITEKHYNCAQAVMVPFADVLGMDEETLYKMGANFGGGMKMAATCGTVTGALMVMGLAGIDEVPELQKLYKTVKDKHDGYLNCVDLLRVMAEKGQQKKAHCDGMVFEMVETMEKLLREKGVITEKNS